MKINQMLKPKVDLSCLGMIAKELKQEPELFQKIMTLSEKRWQRVIDTFMSKYPGRKYKS